MEHLLAWIEDVGAGDIRGHQVRRELNAFELAGKEPGDNAHEKGLGRTRNPLDQDVTAREERDKYMFDQFVLADDNFRDFPPGGGVQVSESPVGAGGIHGRRIPTRGVRTRKRWPPTPRAAHQRRVIVVKGRDRLLVAWRVRQRAL